MAPPTVFGVHQPGVATPPLERLAIAAFDVEAAHVVARLREWTGIAEAVMRAGGGTVTIGLGAGVFARGRRPVGLTELPAFTGDALEPARCGGDLCVLAAPEQIARFGTPRWVLAGEKGDTLGFRDGTLIPRRGQDRDRHVWVGTGDRTGMTGGTYLVVRDIVVDPAFSALPTSEQERIIGRHKDTGAPLGGRTLYEPPDLDRLAPDAHIRVASPRTNQGVKLLRRGYATEDGLLFLAFMRDPRRQYVPLQRKLAEHDALSAYARHTASALFAIPPGAQPRGFVGDRLLGY